MADIETLGILDEIQALLSDKLQVVSYKWLSRNFLVPSNTAKRLLQEFVEKNGSQLEVIYSLSGWLKNNPEAYHIKLVLGSKLSEAKEEFNDSCSVQIYSVQACVPKDPAVIWSTEFIQSQQLFNEPPDAVNCLRDNRFCGISNTFVKRNTEGTHVTTAGPPLGVHAPSKTNSTNHTSVQQQKKVDQVDHKPVAHKEQIPQIPANKKKIQNEKNSSGTASSLATMWGRASAKPKTDSASVKTDTSAPISNDAQVRANELVEDESSDDEQMNSKRAINNEGNNRKRRFVLDYSDEDDNDDDNKDVVNLSSPDPPKNQVFVNSKKNSKISNLENKNLDFDNEQKEEKLEVKKEKVLDTVSKSILKEEKHSPKNDTNRDEKNVAVKKRKVLKTRIDERGREVTEVVWEDDEKETKADDNTRKDKGDINIAANNVVNRPVATAPKKSPAVGNPPSHTTGGKTGNKKTAIKDPKQGNIMSFFKKK